MVACPARAELRCYLNGDGSLEPERLEEIELHIDTCRSCQKTLDTLTEEEAPPATTLPLLPGYRVYKYLGAGTFGEVWLAQDLNLPRVVAAKTLKVGVAGENHVQALEALRQDAHLMTEVEHPNIVRVYAWLTVHDQHYLVMQYVSGGSLADLLKNEGPLDWQRASRYVADVGEGLVEVHSRGIVHRDVKPANILWDPRRDEALLTDFGIAARLTEPTSIAGSIPYMAPEAYDGRVLPSLDVYSLAATLFHLITGSAPFPGPGISDFRQQIRRGLPDPDRRCAAIPEPLERIIRGGLEADPKSRPSLKEFVSTLRGRLNRLIVDRFTMSHRMAAFVPGTEPATGAPAKPPSGPTTVLEPPAPRPAPVDLRLVVSRQVSPLSYVPVAATHPQPPPGRVTRDMKKVPQSPDQVRLRTGERVRIDVLTDQPGFLTVFNVGPTGTLNLLYPDVDPRGASPTPRIEPNQPLHIVDVEMTPPAGPERLFAVWSRQPLPLRVDELHSLVERKEGDPPASRPYVATRDMKRVQQSVEQLRQEDWQTVALALDHCP
jgi:serine/threonine protein kinase